MDRIGRILRWEGGVATVEVGKDQECMSGSCADCHAGPGERWSLEVPWARPARIGQRVLVKPRRNVHKAVRWGGFLLAFCLVLWAADSLSPGVRGGPGERWAVILGIALGSAVWEVLRRSTKAMPQYRVVALDPPEGGPLAG